MKNLSKRLFVFVLCIAMLSVGYAVGTTGKIHTEYSRPTVYVDGEKIEYVYADGTRADAFMSTEWVTYMPVRAIAEALGKDVQNIDGTIYITTPGLAVEGDVLYEDELVKIIYQGIGENYRNPTIKLHIENKSDMDIIVGDDDISVNGYMVDTIFGEEVAANKKSNAEIDLYGLGAQTVTKDYIKEFELKFTIGNAETYELLKTTSAISVTVE